VSAERSNFAAPDGASTPTTKRRMPALVQSSFGRCLREAAAFFIPFASDASRPIVSPYRVECPPRPRDAGTRRTVICRYPALERPNRGGRRAAGPHGPNANDHRYDRARSRSHQSRARSRRSRACSARSSDSGGRTDPPLTGAGHHPGPAGSANCPPSGTPTAARPGGDQRPATDAAPRGDGGVPGAP
jgi:hypothetical protein